MGLILDFLVNSVIGVASYVERAFSNYTAISALNFLLTYLLVFDRGGSAIATRTKVVFVLIVHRLRKIPKALLIRN